MLTAGITVGLNLKPTLVRAFKTPSGRVVVKEFQFGWPFEAQRYSRFTIEHNSLEDERGNDLLEGDGFKEVRYWSKWGITVNILVGATLTFIVLIATERFLLSRVRAVKSP